MQVQKLLLPRTSCVLAYGGSLPHVCMLSYVFSHFGWADEPGLLSHVWLNGTLWFCPACPPPCSTMWRFPPGGLSKCLSFVLECVVGDWPFWKDPFWFHFIFSLFFSIFGSISLQDSLLRTSAAGGAVPSRQQHSHGCSEICSGDEEGCFKTVSQRISCRNEMQFCRKISIQSIDFTFPIAFHGLSMCPLNHVRWKIWLISGSVSWLHCLQGLPRTTQNSMRFWWTWRVTSLGG